MDSRRTTDQTGPDNRGLKAPEHDPNDPTTWPPTIEQHLAEHPEDFENGVPAAYEQEAEPDAPPSQPALMAALTDQGLELTIILPWSAVLDVRTPPPPPAPDAAE